MKIRRKTTREKNLRALRLRMERDKASPSRISKWLKLMESKKKLFSLEDEIDRLSRELQSSKATKK